MRLTGRRFHILTVHYAGNHGMCGKKNLRTKRALSYEMCVTAAHLAYECTRANARSRPIRGREGASGREHFHNATATFSSAIKSIWEGGERGGKGGRREKKIGGCPLDVCRSSARVCSALFALSPPPSYPISFFSPRRHPALVLPAQTM